MFMKRFAMALALALAACGSEPDTLVPDADVTADAMPSTDCTSALGAGQERLCSVDVGGVRREYLLYAPASFDARKPAALFVDAHGTGEDMAQQAGTEAFFDWPAGLGSGFRLVADREGFLV